MTAEMFSELAELSELMASNRDDAFIRNFLGRTMYLNQLQGRTRQDWVQCLATHKDAYSLKLLEYEADSYGPFCRVEILKNLLNKVPQELHNSFIYGYLSGVVDYRLATEDPEEPAASIQ